MNSSLYCKEKNPLVINEVIDQNTFIQTAFVTYSRIPNLTEDDKILAEYLSQKNISVRPVLWDDETVDWQRFDAVILRSMWDYFERPEEFNKWIDKLERLGCKVLNPLSIVRWNRNKNYFDDFSGKGFSLPPYVICIRRKNESLKKIMEDKGLRKAVVKPAVSGGAYNTWITSIDTADADQVRFTELLEKGDVIIQQFVEEIITKGELSLVFFNREFSHAFRKKVKPGDFRVQSQFGGTEEAIDPDDYVLNCSANILNSITGPLLYARVDGVIRDDGEFLLMELELIEPSLSVAGNDRACENFYAALIEILID
ncbi:MAG TPA: hypothetical protein VMT35_05270 [Ignavibacteriaceae bacterium]|nr:hypothetical protein [Ignavibacteriaceae bacterium]